MLLMSTSGTTGSPKFVRQSYLNVISNTQEIIKYLKIKEELKKVTQDAHDKEIFGAPTFVVNNKIFWGQDRLEFALDEYNK